MLRPVRRRLGALCPWLEAIALFLLLARGSDRGVPEGQAWCLSRTCRWGRMGSHGQCCAGHGSQESGCAGSAAGTTSGPAGSSAAT
eukprot:349276-Lingulodinium_polyedra.AAC.1